MVEVRNPRSQSAERRTKKSASKLEAGSSATLTRGFHLPQSSRSLWQRVFVGKKFTMYTKITRNKKVCQYFLNHDFKVTRLKKK